QTSTPEKTALQGIESRPLVPHDETALAGYEVTDEYRIVKDYSIYVKLSIVNKPREYLLIWTTTPWTLPANEGVMVHPDMIYAVVEVNGENLIIAKERLSPLLGEQPHKITQELKGQERVRGSYVPPAQEETHQ